MGKLWVPISLLLLLLILCSWVQRNSFDHAMAYTISKHENTYQLRGTLSSGQTIKQIKNEFVKHGISLDVSEANTSALMKSRGSLAIVYSFIPVFVSQYKKGSITHTDAGIEIAGVVESESAIKQSKAVLGDARMHVDNKTIIVKPLLISFDIKQYNGKSYILKGEFAHPSQKQKLIRVFEDSRAILIPEAEDINPDRNDKKAILGKLGNIIPLFVSRVKDGNMLYRDGTLMIAGKVFDKRWIVKLEKQLSKLDIEYENNTTLDVKAIKGSRARAKAKRHVKALQKQRAKKEAVKKAEKEISEDISVMMDTKNKKTTSSNSKVRKNLSVLFETEIIEFNAAKTTLTAFGLGAVVKIAVILKTYPDVKIEIAGHTDSEGDDSFNMLLSQGRVNNAKRALMKAGISKDRIKAVGYGETKPLLPNTTHENRKKNRRVEIIVIGD
ncbi:MAG: OmpA family protein [Sulfurovum sp.]|nr:OmpA family protein [Sulfurovum sp.]